MTRKKGDVVVCLAGRTHAADQDMTTTPPSRYSLPRLFQRPNVLIKSRSRDRTVIKKDHRSIKPIHLFCGHFILYLNEPIAIPPEFVRKIDDHTLEIDLVRGKTLTDVVQELSAHNIKIKTLRNKTNRLEELFIKLTRADNNV